LGHRKFGDHDVRASFLPDLTRALDTVQHRLERLSGLAYEFPPDARRTLSAEGRALFQQVVHVHATKLRTAMSDLREHLSVMAGTVTVSQPGPDPTGLLSHAPLALSRAAALSREVQALLAHDEVSLADHDQMRTMFQALWKEVYGPTLPHSR
jgi:hypothetical protein